MILALDVHYPQVGNVTAAALALSNWEDDHPALEWSGAVDLPPQDYKSGAFYERELPYLLEIVRHLKGHVLDLADVDTIIVDGYVWLGEGRPGLGAHLHEALAGAVSSVVGIGKSEFKGAGDVAVPVMRGGSHRPLYVTAIGMDLSEAAEHIRSMHGCHRIPSPIKRVDHLTRGHE